ncbi:peptidase domain-containing ABC transporter [Streptomyces sp. NPDC046261]|uniref:peptidase domain-containing ABC transporter n=1 Tax=Streptomyces sp. NPDC046261 TaxID=3157200 RepID=UPI0033CC20A0
MSVRLSGLCPSNRTKARVRVPVLLQMSTAECGAACLAMILSAHGRHTKVAECRDSLHIGRDGANALQLVRLARRRGMRVRALSVDLASLREVPGPAIIHWNFNHYLVLERWDGKRAVVVDPASGRRVIAREEFSEGFTGVVLAFTPAEDFRPRPSRRRVESFRFARGLLSVSRGMLAAILLASLLLQLLLLIPSAVTKFLVDEVLGYGQDDLLGAVVVGGLLFLMTHAIATYTRGILLNHFETRMDGTLMRRFFGHLLDLPYRYFVLRGSGDLLMRLSSNALIREVLTGQTVSFVLDGAFVLAYVILFLVVAPLYGWVVLGLGCAQLLIMLANFRRLRSLAQRDIGAQAEAQSCAVEVLAGVETVKAMGGERQAYARWSALFERQLQASFRRRRLDCVLEATMGTFRIGAPILLLLIGVREVMAGRLSVGSMLALNALTNSLLGPMATLIGAARQLQSVAVTVDRLRDVLDEETEQDRTAVRAPGRITGSVELSGAGLRYGGDGPWAVRDVNLSLPAGAKVALVGRTGSGKTTLARLILGLHVATEGEVRFDGKPLVGLDYRELRHQCGVVTQEPALFACSVRENIAFGHEDASLEDIVRAARHAQIHDEITAMPMGYETVLTEGGGGLSGGQRQRLALARALVREPALLVLDEATSHLDVVTEQRVDDVLARLECTRVVIAHRLSTVIDADLIVVLKDGRVVETGTHAELLDRRSEYAALVAGQLSPRGSSGRGLLSTGRGVPAVEHRRDDRPPE